MPSNGGSHSVGREPNKYLWDASRLQHTVSGPSHVHLYHSQCVIHDGLLLSLAVRSLWSTHGWNPDSLWSLLQSTRTFVVRCAHSCMSNSECSSLSHPSPSTVTKLFVFASSGLIPSRCLFGRGLSDRRHRGSDAHGGVSMGMAIEKTSSFEICLCTV